MAANEEGPVGLPLLPFRREREDDQGAYRCRPDLRRLRDRRVIVARTAAPDPDVGGRGPHGGPGRGQVPGKAVWRPRGPARRRTRCTTGQGGHLRWRNSWVN